MRVCFANIARRAYTAYVQNGILLFAFVAQSVERAAVNRKVIGSNPVEGDIFFTYI